MSRVLHWKQCSSGKESNEKGLELLLGEGPAPDKVSDGQIAVERENPTVEPGIAVEIKRFFCTEFAAYPNPPYPNPPNPQQRCFPKMSSPVFPSAA